MQVHIRPMQPDDAPAVNDLSAELGYPLSISETEVCIDAVLTAEGNCAFVAIIDEKIVGWIHAFKTVRVETLPFAEIAGLVVSDTHRGKGIGKKLVQRIEAWCSEIAIADLRLRCNTKRKESHKFYRVLGFNETKEQKVFQKKVVDFGV